MATDAAETRFARRAVAWAREVAVAVVAAALLAGCAAQPARAPSPAPIPAPPLAASPETTAPIEMAMAVPGDPFVAALRRHGVPYQPPAQGKAILVNLPSYELIAFENGREALRSKVIVGAPRTQTPVMDTETSVVRFRPSWRPTPDMIASGEYQDKVVPPGRKNPLGLLAVRLEPGLLIYLHGTNKPKLFEREKRALSHGCIRVEKWDELAAWVLGVDLPTVHAAAEGGRTFDMDAWGIPVHLRYYTEFPDETGALVEHADIYGRGRTPLRPEPLVAEAPAEPPPEAVFGPPPPLVTAAAAP